MMFISVDLPEPDGPMMATNSPVVDAQVDAVERAHFDLAEVVDLDELADLDDGAVATSASPASAAPAAARTALAAHRRRPFDLRRGHADDDRVAFLQRRRRRPA